MGTKRTTLDPTLDFTFKVLLGSPEGKSSLVALLNTVLRPATPIRDVRVLNPEVNRRDLEDKTIVLDLLVELDDGSRTNIEMQVIKVRGFRGRSLYYWARVFGSQLNRGDDYTALKPVISILFLDYVELPGARLHSVFRLSEIHDGTVLTNALELHVIELPKRGLAQQEDADLLAWCQFLGADTDEEVQEACMANPAVEHANELLEELSNEPTIRDQAWHRQLAIDLRRIEMATIREEKREAREEGLAEGLAEGLRAGVVALAEVLGVELDAARKDQLARMSANELQELIIHLRRAQSW